MKVGFFVENLIRPVCDYAYHNVSVLENSSVVFFFKNDSNLPIEKNYIQVDTFNEVEDVILSEGVEFLYQFCQSEIYKSKNVPNLFHSLQGNENNSFISFFDLPFIVVDQISDLDFRSNLNIHENSKVIGVLGDIKSPFVKETIEEISSEYKHIYFFFLKTELFVKNNSILYTEEIKEFLNVSDFILIPEKNWDISLELLEFNFLNKLIISQWSSNRSHFKSGSFLSFWDKESLKNVILFSKRINEKYVNSFEENTPENIMEIFQEIFLINT